MKNQHKFPCSLRVLAMFLCIVLVTGVIGTGTALAAPADYSVSISEKLADIYWKDEPTTKDLKFAFNYKVTNNTNSKKTLTVRTTWEEKPAGETAFRQTDLVTGKNPDTISIEVSKKSSKTETKSLGIVSEIGIEDSKKGMIYRCLVELLDDNGNVIQSIRTGEARLYYSAVVKFDKNDGSWSWFDPDASTFATQEVKYGEYATAPATNPTNGKLTFGGWYKDSAGNRSRCTRDG